MRGLTDAELAFLNNWERGARLTRDEMETLPDLLETGRVKRVMDPIDGDVVDRTQAGRDALRVDALVRSALGGRP